MNQNTCPKCQAVVPENTKFCPECGSPVETSAPVANVTDPKKLKKKKRRRNFVIFIAIVAAIVGVSKISSAIKARIDWDEIVLGEMIPTPPVTKGEIYSNTSERLSVSLDGVTPKQYAEYVDECADEGYASETNSTDSSYEAFNKEGYKIQLSYYSSSEELSVTLDKPEKMSEIEWPDSTAAKKLPKPKSNVGKFSYEYDDSFYLEIAGTSKSDYADYVKKCSEKGFKVDYDKGDDYYYADNSEGWSLSLKYQGNNIMSIDIDAPDEEETTKPSKTETTTEKPTEEETTTKQSGSSVSSDFKKTMDEYEKFMDKYVDFMNKYKDNPSDLGLLADYAKMMSDYADYCDKIDNIDEDELSDDDLAYMLEVTARVDKKLIDVID